MPTKKNLLMIIITIIIIIIIIIIINNNFISFMHCKQKNMKTNNENILPRGFLLVILILFHPIYV